LAARLNADITTAPDGELQGQTGPSVVNDLSNPQALAFDADDNLWVAYFSFNIIARYTTAERAMNGPIRPAVQLVLPVDVLLESIAFDDAGGLWFTSAAGKVARLESAALSADGPSSASTILTVASLGYASGIAFNPPSAGLPIAFAEF
jgi:streptogramin lyase